MADGPPASQNANGVDSSRVITGGNQVIDLKSETPLSLAQAAALLPPSRGGRRVHRSFLIRAITRGTNGVRLEAVRIGRRWITSVEAIERWLEGQTERAAGEATRGDGTRDRPTASARRRAEAADHTLRRLGL
jgi:hypothetical protein